MRRCRGAGDALVDDPQQFAAFGLADVQAEFLGELSAQGVGQR
ncbi:hypothetical protein OG258_49480 [Streptomyces mirabilis]|nr:hypothetical protein [Streptomyces mirabilis]